MKASVCFPSLIIVGVNTKIRWDEHWEHWATLPPLEERAEYSYQNIRNKPFPWGDGDKVCSLGHFDSIILDNYTLIKHHRLYCK